MAAPRYVTKALTVAADNNGICEGQTPLAGGDLDLDGILVTDGVADLTSQRQVLFTFAADETGRTFVVYGTDDQGISISESVAGTATTAVTLLNYNTVTRITIDAASAGALTVGTNGVGATPWQIVNWHVAPMNFGFAGLVTGTVNYTVQYTMEDPGGTYPNGSEIPTAFNITDLASKSADTAAGWTTPIAAWRVQVNSGTGSVTVAVLQAGLSD